MQVTVFTPTYNRAHKLERVYKSLCRQSRKDFEWLIVDDGSSDNTGSVVEGFKAEGLLNIRYEYQGNGGKHRAINRGLQLAHGEYFFIVDSDDAATPDAIEFILKNGEELLDNDSFAGLSGTDITLDGTPLSHFPDENSIDAKGFEIRFKFGVEGDLAEVFKTDILRTHVFPEIEGERFCPEVLVWNRVYADGYKMRFFTHAIKKVEYLPDGLSASIVRQRMNSPVASTTCYAEMLGLDIPFKQKIRAAINYWRFKFCPSALEKPKVGIGWTLLAPIGFLMHCNDKRTT